MSTQPRISLELFRKNRINGSIDKFISIIINDIEKSIFKSTDNGRICIEDSFLNEKNHKLSHNFDLNEKTHSSNLNEKMSHSYDNYVSMKFKDENLKKLAD